MSRKQLSPKSDKTPINSSCADPSKRSMLKSTLFGLSTVALTSMIPGQSALTKSHSSEKPHHPNDPKRTDLPNQTGEHSHWDEKLYKDILSRINAPVFPNRHFKILNFGAQAGHDCTKAIHEAMHQCHKAGGGHVIIPAGTFYCSAIHLKSNIDLHIEKNAILKFSTNPRGYPSVLTRFEGTECMNYSPLIYAHGQKNGAVTGQGTVDGQAALSNWWAWKDKSKPKPYKQSADSKKLIEMSNNDMPVKERVFGDGHFLRPCFIEPHCCENVLVEGITIKNSPMWEVHPTLCKNVTVRNVTIQSHGPNNDGCNPECCTDVLIEDCKFNTGDDCIAIKSGKNKDSRRVHIPSQNIIIRKCHILDGHGGVVMGSECSGHIYNVFVKNCEMSSPKLQRALHFKDNAVRGGHIENVYMRKKHF
ncbi:MAG: hypothetical protein CENE_02498 [Candidatus Celerinatantimonas neptuna]|nr:MAG: hypothetical protein CENE_02498 [Candidatus Celerinatantimonas neptuna]